MREILFKGKRIDNGEWVEGGYLNKTDYYGIECDNHYIIDGTQTDTEGYGEHYLVDKDTICQYTGLTDKNGNKIWENDIVTESSCHYKGFVEYIGAEYSIEWNGNPYIRHDISFWVRERELEVIGNTFDNPELLKEE